MILILINLSGLEVSLKICAIPTQNLFQLPGPSAIWFLLLPSSLAAWPSVATAVGPLEAARLRAKEFELARCDNSSPPMMGFNEETILSIIFSVRLRSVWQVVNLPASYQMRTNFYSSKLPLYQTLSKFARWNMVILKKWLLTTNRSISYWSPLQIEKESPIEKQKHLYQWPLQRCMPGFAWLVFMGILPP